MDNSQEEDQNFSGGKPKSYWKALYDENKSYTTGPRNVIRIEALFRIGMGQGYERYKEVEGVTDFAKTMMEMPEYSDLDELEILLKANEIYKSNLLLTLGIL